MTPQSVQVLADRLLGGMRRRALAFPLLKSLDRSWRERLRRVHRATLAPPPSHLDGVLEQLERSGLFMASAEEASALGCVPPEAGELFAELECAASCSTVRRKAADYDALTPAYLAGLHPSLLLLAEHYIGLPPLYLGFEAKVEFPDGAPVGVRHWHFDLEDARVLKILIYFSDVSSDGGPLEYLSPWESACARRRGARGGFNPGLTIAPDLIGQCQGPTGTAIFFDGARLLHRVKPPTSSLRRSLTFSYVSNKPRQIFAGARVPMGVREEVHRLLTDEQLRCIP